MMPLFPRLLAALGDPAILLDLEAASWNGLLGLARRMNVLSRLAVLAAETDILRRLPDGPAAHLEAAQMEADKFHRDLRWELRYVQAAFADFPCRPILLKGSSYVASGVRARTGRLFGDIDLLVPHEHLDAAERVLIMNGWATVKDDEYDSFFYRRWTHQLPPMRHIARQSTIDLHHSLRPPLGTERVDMAPFFAQARPAAGGLDVPSPHGMLIHSAAHLFCGGDFRHGLRDLSDIDLLMREFGTDPDWWRGLAETAQELRLVKPLALALVHGRQMLGSPVPDAVLEEVLSRAGRGRRHPIDALLRRAIGPEPPRFDGRDTAARWALYVRGYLHDMPPHLLAIHIGHRLYTLARDAVLRTERAESGIGRQAGP